MNDKFDENSLNEQAINDVETARLALRWSLDKIRALQEDGLKTRQNLQERASQAAFLENQLKTKNSEIEKIIRTHDEEIKSKHDSLEYQFRLRLERLTEREKELEDKLSKHEEVFKQRESSLHDEYQKKSEELRTRWSQVEAELWQLRQEQLSKQQESEKTHSARLEDEKRRLREEAELSRASQESAWRARLEEMEKLAGGSAEEFRKQEAVFKWSRDSWQKEVEEREKALRQRELETERALLEKDQEMQDSRAKLALAEKQLNTLPEAVRKRDLDLERYRDALSSLEGVVKTLEAEKKNQRLDYEGRIAQLGRELEAAKTHFGGMEAEIPQRLKLAVEHERDRFAQKLGAAEEEYSRDLKKSREEIEYLSRNLKVFEEAMKTMQVERDAAAQKCERVQTQLNIKSEEASFREKQLQSEYEVRLKVELEKHAAALRAELESAGRIYEDSLRVKAEEIVHLRKDLEDAFCDKSSQQNLISALRRDIDALGEKHERDLQSLRAQLKSEGLAEVAAALEAAAGRHADEKQKLLAAGGEAVAQERQALAKKDEEIVALKLAAVIEQENRKLALAEAAALQKKELDAQAARFAEEGKLAAERMAQLGRAIDGARIEGEELALAERERLTRLYSEKERDFDERLAQKSREAARLKEDCARLASENEAQSMAAREAAAVLHDKNSALSQQLLGLQAAASLEQEAAVLREREKAAECLIRRNGEIEALRQRSGAQEESYRRALEELRLKLSEAVNGTEAVRRLADERQLRLNALEGELAAAMLKLEAGEKEIKILKSGLKGA